MWHIFNMWRFKKNNVYFISITREEKKGELFHYIQNITDFFISRLWLELPEVIWKYLHLMVLRYSSTLPDDLCVVYKPMHVVMRRILICFIILYFLCVHRRFPCWSVSPNHLQLEVRRVFLATCLPKNRIQVKTLRRETCRGRGW